jgi:hypothetical protein
MKLKSSKIYRNISFKAGPCDKNQTSYPFVYDKKYIKLIGGVDKIWMDMKHDVLEDLHGPFKVTIDRTKLSFYSYLRNIQ